MIWSFTRMPACCGGFSEFDRQRHQLHAARQVIIGARELSEAGLVECWVSDNGAGIAADRLEKIFDKLETDTHKEGAWAWASPSSRPSSRPTAAP